jgi:hypothetical protein
MKAVVIGEFAVLVQYLLRYGIMLLTCCDTFAAGTCPDPTVMLGLESNLPLSADQ